jgi:esterase
MKLHFRKTGKGEPLIIVHGLYGSSDNWASVAGMLSPYFTVFIPDQRNHGRSPHHPTHTYDDLKNDLAHFMDEQHLEKAILLGHSMGGKTVMWFAADYPERVTRLIVADIAPKDYLSDKRTSQYLLHKNILQALKNLNLNNVKNRKEADKLLADKIDDPRLRQFLLKNLTRNKSTSLFSWKINTEVLYASMKEIVSGVNKQWFSDRIPITAYPVTFIRGEQSPYILPGDETLIRDIYPEARIIPIPKAGHWLHAEKPDPFVRAVRSFS